MQLHRKYADQGLVVITLDVVPEEWERKGEIVQFLTDKKADTTNSILQDAEEAVEKWQKRYGVEYTPFTLLFNRKGERVPVPEGEKEEEALLKKLLAAK